MLFRVGLGRLQFGSEAFRELLDIPAPPFSQEGVLEEQPIILHGVGAREFTSFCSWLYNSYVFFTFFSYRSILDPKYII